MGYKQKFRPNPDLKLTEQVRQVLRYHHYAYRTEQSYCQWIVRFIRHFDAKVHPRDMGKIVVPEKFEITSLEGVCHRF